MNRILIETHKKSNINLLKARDAFFDKARIRHGWYLVTVFIPPILAGLSYLPINESFKSLANDYRDYFIGVITIIFFIVSELILKKINDDLTISNALREEYDLNVFGINRNEFAYETNLLKDRDGKYKDNIIEAWKRRKDISKYEVWYQEIFSEKEENKKRDILCLQLDNIIYTHQIYKEYKRLFTIILVFCGAAIFEFLLISLFVWEDIKIFVLMLFSLFSLIQTLIIDYKNVNELIDSVSHIYEYVGGKDGNTNMERIESIKNELDDPVNGPILLRSLQDIALMSREKSIFVPKWMRLKNLDNGSEYYKHLDIVKNSYMVDPVIPSSSADIDILSSFGEKVATMDEIHKRLLEMLKDIDKAFRESNIDYMFDGGNLIGTCRDEKGFLFWDDDVDLAIKIDGYNDSKIEDAKRVIQEKLRDKYIVQDYDNEPYYAPYLSNFRIREKKPDYILEEKDSELCDKYGHRGLFIDVYAYSPIVINRAIDSLIRKIMFTGFSFKIIDQKSYSESDPKCVYFEPFKNMYLYHRIHNEENRWKHNDVVHRAKHLRKWERLKKRYLDKVKKYLKMAKCTKYYAYVPNYIYDPRKAGPYIRSEAFAGTIDSDFVDMKVPVPVGYEMVLEAYYGDWRKSPFIPLDELESFSKKKFDATKLKHIKYINKWVLETERLFLREMTMDDYDALYDVLADSENMQHYPYTFDEERVRSWIERNMNRYKDNGFGLWAVCLKETGEMIGDCGLTLQNIEGEMLPEIGYHIRRDMQRKGYAKEAASAVRDWAFANTEYPAIYSYCKYTNEGSFKTAESIGMHFCKEYPDEANGITHVSVITREDL